MNRWDIISIKSTFKYIFERLVIVFLGREYFETFLSSIYQVLPSQLQNSLSKIGRQVRELKMMSITMKECFVISYIEDSPIGVS